MGYLETFNNSIEYNEKIGDNGFSIGPSVSIYKENVNTKVKYVKCPSYKLTYDKSTTNLFNNGFNIKRVWDENGLIFENNNPVTDFEIVVTENDIIYTADGTGFSYVNPLIMISPSYYETIEVSLPNDDILETDGFGFLLYSNNKYGVFGGPVKQLKFPDGFGHINGKMYIPSSVLNQFEADKFSLYVEREDKILTSSMKFTGVDNKIEIDTERNANGIPILPENVYIEFLTLESEIVLDDYNDGVFMRVTAGENEMFQIFPIIAFKEQNAQVIDNKKLVTTLGGSLSDMDYEVCFCHITWENNEPLTSIIDYDLIEETTAKVSIPLNAKNITKTSDKNFTIKYEPYNRFKGLMLKGTNIINIYDSLKNITQLEGTQFHDCNFLTKLVIPNTVTKILDSNIFNDCQNLEYIELPNTITNIEKLHFYDLPSLKTIVCYANIQDQISVYNIAKEGVIKVPFGSDTSCWDSFVRNYDWKIEYI